MARARGKLQREIARLDQPLESFGILVGAYFLQPLGVSTSDLGCAGAGPYTEHVPW